MNMEVKGVEADGYCFLNAVVKVLSTDYNEHITVEKVMQTVMKYLCSNFDKYTKYHCQRKEDMEPTLADTLIADVGDFFYYFISEFCVLLALRCGDCESSLVQNGGLSVACCSTSRCVLVSCCVLVSRCVFQ